MNSCWRYLIGCILSLVVFSACEQSTNYSQQLVQEQKKIDAWFERMGYQIETHCPADSAFVVGQWYHLGTDEIYFCVDTLGNGARIADGDDLVVRYSQSTLDVDAINYDYWTTTDNPNPQLITKGLLTNSCNGWDNAFDVMRYSGTIARVIVPSKLGFSEASNIVEPYFYRLWVRVAPK